MVEEATVTAFMGLFRGRTDAWGSVEGRSNKEKVTKDHYAKHLEGKISLGIYPLLDDGTCWFFAVDIDDRDLNKALTIRKAFLDLGINVYLATSKSKGYHCYGFADKKPFSAGEIRDLCHGILNKLSIAAEVFPKQDKIDATVSLGNYINLPCFGSSRRFITGQKVGIDLTKAIQLIKRVPDEKIKPALKHLPPPVQPKLKVTKGRPRKGKHPPCVEDILKGVATGSRDIAAFALARHYLDQQYTPEEVLGLLIKWDSNNHPPLGDQHLLETKVRSALKGYQFGCSSVVDEPFLKDYCVGIDACPWLKAANEEKKKKGLIREQSFHETDTHLYEEILKDGRGVFVSYEKSTGNIDYISSIDYPNFSIVPIMSAEITEGAVTLPTGVLECGNTVEIKNEIRNLIKTYVDFKDDTDLEFNSWYVLLSWVFDRLNTISYARYKGDTGVGKSRALDVVGRLCYKPLMMAGAVTPAPIYRLIRRFRGTLILEEADFRDTSEKSEIVTILNSGFEKNRPVIRCSHDNPDILEILPCFGPKVFATRYDFQDAALEARCMTFVMEETDRDDIPALLGTTFAKRAQELRNKLLMWRLRNRGSIDPDVVEDIDIGPLEPRLKQIGLPFAIPFKDFPDVMDEFRGFMAIRQEKIIQQRSDSSDGKVVQAMFKMADVHGKNNVTPSLISECLTEEFKIEKNSQSVGKTLSSLNISRSNRRVPGGRARYLNWDDKLMKKLLRRYIVDPDDFKDLFEEEIDVEV